ncbi:unnamed protein product [Rhizopus stolonifer]
MMKRCRFGYIVCGGACGMFYLKCFYGSSPLMMTTNTAARSLDIPGVGFVANFNFLRLLKHILTVLVIQVVVQLTLFFTLKDKAHSGELINVFK